MSTLRVSNIEAKADASSPTIDEKIKVTNSQGRVLVQIDGKTAGITTVGINTTGNTFTVNTNNGVTFAGIVTSTGGFSGNLTGNVNSTSGVTTVTTLNVGAGGTFMTTTNSGLVGIGTISPTRSLHLAANTVIEQVWEQLDGKANTKKYNLVVDGGNAATTPNIYLRYLNDSLVGGNTIWTYNGASQIHQIYSNGNQIATVNGSGINVTGIVTASTAVNAPGSIVQVIHKDLGYGSFSATNTSPTYRATGFTNSITPKFTTSRIYHVITIGCQFICDGQLVIYRNGSQVGPALQDSYRDGVTASYTNDLPLWTIQYLDTTSISNLSAINYELYCRATGCGGVMFVGSSGDASSCWTIMEVAN
jgi:hypothetical protein